jgi:hypothetical protein
MRSQLLRAARIGAAAATFALAAAPSPTAHAEEPSRAVLAKAREEFRRGLALEAAGDWSGALAAFKDVALVKSTPQVRFHIAQCEEKVGQWVQALGSYRLASYEAHQAKVKDVEAASETALKALEPKIPKLTIRRGEGAAVATVIMDGREVAATMIGTEMAANPGPHRIEATAPGREQVVIEINLAESEAKAIDLVLPPVKVAEPVKPVEEKKKVVEAPPPPKGTSPVRITGYVLTGLGVAGLAVSGLSFWQRQSAISELDAACGPDRQSCPPDLTGTRDRGQLFSTLGMATLIGGGACLVGGVTMIIAAPSSTAASPTVGVAPFAGPTTAGATVLGRF